MKGFKEYMDEVNEAMEEYMVDHPKGGRSTVKARSEKEAIDKAARNMGLGRKLAKEQPEKFKIKKT